MSNINNFTDEHELNTHSILCFTMLLMSLLLFFIMLFALSEFPTINQLRRVRRKIIYDYVCPHNVKPFVDIFIKPDGLLISFDEKKYMFAPGKTNIYTDTKKIVMDVLSFLKDEPNDIVIIGHADNIEPFKPKFKSRMELLVARACDFIKCVIDELKFDPKNRRIEILMSQSSGRK